MRWLEEGILPPPLRINLVFGVPGGIDATPEALEAHGPPAADAGTFWTVTCIGRHHPRMLALALLHDEGHPDRSWRTSSYLEPERSGALERRPGRDGGPA